MNVGGFNSNINVGTAVGSSAGGGYAPSAVGGSMLAHPGVGDAAHSSALNTAGTSSYAGIGVGSAAMSSGAGLHGIGLTTSAPGTSTNGGGGGGGGISNLDDELDNILGGGTDDFLKGLGF